MMPDHHALHFPTLSHSDGLLAAFSPREKASEWGACKKNGRVGLTTAYNRDTLFPGTGDFTVCGP
jgi:hypothetical protein